MAIEGLSVQEAKTNGFKYVAGFVPVDSDGTSLVDTATHTLKMSVTNSQASMGSATHWSPRDFSATYASNATLTLAGGSFTPDYTTTNVSYVVVRNAAGTQTIYANGVNGISLRVASGTLTITGATPFLNTDTEYKVYLIYQNKAFNSTDNAIRSKELYPVYNQYAYEKIVTTAANTFYVDMDGYSCLNMQYVQVNGAVGANNTVTSVYLTMQNDGTAASGCTYNDITSAIYTATTITTNSGALTAMIVDDACVMGAGKYVKLDVSTCSNAELTIHCKKMYKG